MAHRLTRRAKERSEFTLLLMADAEADNVITMDEWRAIKASKADEHMLISAADAAEAVADALKRAVGDEGYRKYLTEQCWSAMDALPTSAA